MTAPLDYSMADPASPGPGRQAWRSSFSLSASGIQSGHEAHIRSLLIQINEAESRERHRIAQDLHDGLGQTLAIAMMKTAELARESLTHSQAMLLDELKCLLIHSVRVTRTVTFELGSPALRDQDLGKAIQDLVDKLCCARPPRMEVCLKPHVPKLPALVAETLFRAVRELIINAQKHAHACLVRVILGRTRTGLEVVVMDDGVGFVPVLGGTLPGPQGGFGLMSLRAQVAALGGSLMVCTSLGFGTHVRIHCPLADKEV